MAGTLLLGVLVSISLHRPLVASILLIAALPTPGSGQTRMDFPPLYPVDATRPAVLVVGTAHLANNNRDMNNAQFDDVLAPKRQEELEALVTGLARFRATKIAVEVPVERQPWLDSLYQAYLRGEGNDDRNEIVQIGFRLAKRLGHARVYAVDWKHDMNIGAVMQWAATHGQGAKAQQMGTWGRALMARMNPAIARMTLTQMLLEANRAENMAIGHQGYLLEARIGADTANPGWEDVAGWYARNLRIFANVSRTVDAPTDRVLVLFGAGHAPLLNHYFEAAGDFDVVSVGSVLR